MRSGQRIFFCYYSVIHQLLISISWAFPKIRPYASFAIRKGRRRVFHHLSHSRKLSCQLATPSRLRLTMASSGPPHGSPAPDVNIGTALIIFNWILAGVAAIFLGLRLFTVLHVLRRIRATDYIMVLAFVRLVYPALHTQQVFSRKWQSLIWYTDLHHNRWWANDRILLLGLRSAYLLPLAR
jgi:hypothetical protein